MSPPEHDISLRDDETFDGQVFVWHDDVHEVLERCRLSFWRLAFVPDYPRREVLETLSDFYKDFGIESHIAYETLGDFDLLLRLWIPKLHNADEIEDAFRERLNLYNVRFLVVRHYSHWSGDAPPPSSAQLDAIDDRVVVAVNKYNEQEAARFDAWLSRSDSGITTLGTGQAGASGLEPPSSPEGVAELVDQRILTPIPLSTRGVRFFVTFDKPNVPFRPPERETALDDIRKLCEQVRGKWAARDPAGIAPQVSLYDGTGTMNEFLVLARAPYGYFHRFARDLVFGLHGIGLDRSFHMRPYTHVLADEMFSEFREYRPPRFDDADVKLTAEDLMRDESDSREYKASFAIDFRTLVTANRRDEKRERKQDIAKAVCGLLNSETGGRLIIGVLEVRREITSYSRPSLLLEWLREEMGYEWPAGAETVANYARLPNAIVGIDEELIAHGGPIKDEEAFRNDVSQILLDWLTPAPGPYFRAETLKVGARAICVVSVRPSQTWHYARYSDEDPGTFYVRQGAATRPYDGYQADLYKDATPRGEGQGQPRGGSRG